MFNKKIIVAMVLAAMITFAIGFALVAGRESDPPPTAEPPISVSADSPAINSTSSTPKAVDNQKNVISADALIKNAVNGKYQRGETVKVSGEIRKIYYWLDATEVWLRPADEKLADRNAVHIKFDDGGKDIYGNLRKGAIIVVEGEFQYFGSPPLGEGWFEVVLKNCVLLRASQQ